MNAFCYRSSLPECGTRFEKYWRKKITLIVKSKSVEPIATNGEEASGHNRRRVRGPDVRFLRPILLTQLVP
jgi:hypothetical protein